MPGKTELAGKTGCDDGTHVDRDFAFVSGPVFDPIWKDRRRFKSIKVVDGCPNLDRPEWQYRGSVPRCRPARRHRAWEADEICHRRPGRDAHLGPGSEVSLIGRIIRRRKRPGLS